MGPHIFQTCPSANYFDCKAMSIGARSQSARTYLERLMDKFSDCEWGEIFRLGALAAPTAPGRRRALTGELWAELLGVTPALCPQVT